MPMLSACNEVRFFPNLGPYSNVYLLYVLIILRISWNRVSGFTNKVPDNCWDYTPCARFVSKSLICVQMPEVNFFYNHCSFLKTILKFNIIIM